MVVFIGETLTYRRAKKADKDRRERASGRDGTPKFLLRSDEGEMSFTKKEAEAKVGKRVRVRNDWLSKKGIPKGTIGRVIGTQAEKQKRGRASLGPQRPAKKKDKEDL
jgi:hypothetical protein